MAQTTSFGPFRYFDAHWQPRLDVAADVLRRIQDRWLMADSPFPIEQTIAVILRVFSFDFHASGFIGYQGVPANELAPRKKIT